jgi:hypothetical protein
LNLQVKEQAAVLVKYNPRSELNGEERTPAADILLQFDTMNTFLEQLEPGLREGLFKKNVDGDLADKGTELGQVRFASMDPPHKFTGEMLNATVTLGVAGGGKIQIQGAKVNDVQVTPRNGGTVSIKLRAQFHPTEKLGGKLSMLDHEEVVLTIEEQQPAPGE